VILFFVFFSNGRVIRVFTGVHEPDKTVMIDSNMPMHARESLIAHQRLFGKTLPHMLERKVRKTRSYGIAEHAKPVPQCLGCGIKLFEEEAINPCCEGCDEKKVRDEKQSLMEVLQQRKQAAWDTCRKCQGGSFDKVTCSNVGCNNFFHRDRVCLDVEDLQKDMDRLCSTERVPSKTRASVRYIKPVQPAPAGAPKKKAAPKKKRTTDRPS
jgi:hypothetical protein